jgi:hypothetical protein
LHLSGISPACGTICPHFIIIIIIIITIIIICSRMSQLFSYQVKLGILDPLVVLARLDDATVLGDIAACINCLTSWEPNKHEVLAHSFMFVFVSSLLLLLLFRPSSARGLHRILNPNQLYQHECSNVS